ncbi:MAG: DUF5683 domain-containing protein [Lutibacter sp.]|nr:DUF5683 domain-containing protein [Lutibacter sp.]
MKVRFFICSLLCCLSILVEGHSQEADSKGQSLVTNGYDFDPLSPSRAAFYAAILPGLGQAYNKKYWKIPLVYAALGAGVYSYRFNNRNFHRARTAYKLRLNGKPDEFDGLGEHIYLSEQALIYAQKGYKKNRDLSVLVTVGLYVLQILEASTNAHLLQHNVDDSLSIRPALIEQAAGHQHSIGMRMCFTF